MFTPREQVLAEVKNASTMLQRAFWEIIDLRKILDNLNLDVIVSLSYLKLAQGDDPIGTSISTYTQTIKKSQHYFSKHVAVCGDDETLLLPDDEIDLLTITKKISQRRKQRDIITSFLSKALGKKFAPPPDFTTFMLDEVIKRWGIDDKETDQLYKELIQKNSVW